MERLDDAGRLALRLYHANYRLETDQCAAAVVDAALREIRRAEARRDARAIETARSAWRILRRYFLWRQIGEQVGSLTLVLFATALAIAGLQVLLWLRDGAWPDISLGFALGRWGLVNESLVSALALRGGAGAWALAVPLFAVFLLAGMLAAAARRRIDHCMRRTWPSWRL